VGALLAEVVQFTGSEEQPYRIFGTSLLLATGVWFMIGLAGVGLCLVSLEGMSAQSAEKSLSDLYRAFPFVLLGGFLGGVVAQWVFQNMLDEADSSVAGPRIVGWTIAGALGGLAIGCGFRSVARIRNGLIGGATGGLVAGVLFDPIARSFEQGDAAVSRFLGFTLIGGASGLAIAALNTATSQMFLEFLTVEGVSREFALIDKTSVLGCSRNAAIVVTNDAGIAEEHLLISHSGNKVTMKCIRNSRLMILNGSAVTECELTHGGQVQVGDKTTLRIRARKGSNSSVLFNQHSGVAQTPPPASRPTIATRQVAPGGDLGGHQVPPATPNGTPSRPTISVRRDPSQN
jgi:hypothetical protein